MDTIQLNSYYRSLVVGVDTKVPLKDGTTAAAVNFDNAATTPPFKTVLKEIVRFSPWYSSIHRGKGYKSALSSEIYEGAREIVCDFVKADRQKDVVIFTKNTTESINMLSYKLFQQDPKQMILSTFMEHLANDLPWRKFDVKYVEIDENGRLSLENLENKLMQYQGKVGLVTVTGVSNVTGHINDIYKIAQLAHQYGARIHVDGAQLVPHLEVDMKPHDQPEHIDFLTFSAHKMYAPFGMGVLIGPKETFDQGEPVYKGGGDVRLVSHEFIEWEESPAKDEAGTPNIMGVVALVKAIKTLESLDMKAVHDYETNLILYAIKRLKEIPGIELYGYDENDQKRVSLISFNLKHIKYNHLAKKLSDEAGIAVRDGLFCAHSYASRLLKLTQDDLNSYAVDHDIPVPGMVRMSLGLYNNTEEIDRFIEALARFSPEY